jgi:TRAP-type mannitol/chloroaromatic compound transport system permease large subunit
MCLNFEIESLIISVIKEGNSKQRILVLNSLCILFAESKAFSETFEKLGGVELIDELLMESQNEELRRKALEISARYIGKGGKEDTHVTPSTFSI